MANGNKSDISEHSGADSRLGFIGNHCAIIPGLRKLHCGIIARYIFLLNNGNASMLAHDAVLLHLAVSATLEAVLAAWADHALGSAHASALRASCAALADEPWPDWLRATAGLSGSRSEAAAEAPLREACRAWATCSMMLAEMIRAQDALLLNKGSTATSSRASQSLVRCSLELSLAAVSGGSSSKQVRKQVGDYVRNGSLAPPPHSAPNITLLLSPSLPYCSYFSSSIVRALPLGDPPSAPLITRLLATLAPQLTALAAQLRFGRMSVSLVLGDILTVATGCSPCPSEGFDYFDCSNVADYVSVSSLRQACAPLLSPAPWSRVRLESMTQYRFVRSEGKQQTFAQDARGLSPALLARLLRLRFVGSRELHTEDGLRMKWAAADASAQADRLFAGSLLLELSPLFTRMMADQLSPRWRRMGGPLALAHLLKLGVPDHVRVLIDALLRTAARAQWELSMHAPRSELALLSLTLDAGGSGFRLLWHAANPPLIALSDAPLSLSSDKQLGSIKQLLSSFHWDEDSGMATFLLPASILAKCPSLYATLCALGPDGLDAVLASRRVADLPSMPQAAAWRALSPPQQLGLDTSVLKRVGVAAAGQSLPGWQVVVARTPSCFAVDVLAPSPIPAAAHVSACVVDGAMRITVTCKSDQDNLSEDDSFSVQLPAAAAEGQPVGTQMSRKLGLICTQVVLSSATASAAAL
ncbi:hypothetical protein T492DRAFT_839361 [Pavlovales sp. CCMP2436]|nr:hypothetical protein T492DRAFT_839361 [Pavlovales sp. CCMP2436]